MIMVHLTVNEPLLLETCLVYCFLMFSSHRCVFFCYLLPPPALPLPRHLTLSFVHQPPPISAQRGQALSVWCKNLLPVKMLTHCCPWDWLTGKKGGKLTLQPLVFNFPCLTVFFFFCFPSFLYRTSTRLGEDRWPSVRGLLCWVSEERALVLSCLLSLQEIVSKMRGIAVIYSSVTLIGGQVLSLLFQSFVCVLCAHLCVSQPLDFGEYFMDYWCCLEEHLG